MRPVIKNRPGQVICVAWPAVMLAALTPEESWRLLIFLFVCVITLLSFGYAIRVFLDIEEEEQTLLTKLRREQALRELRMQILQGQATAAYHAAVKDAGDGEEEPDSIALFNEAQKWGGEQP